MATTNAVFKNRIDNAEAVEVGKTYRTQQVLQLVIPSDSGQGDYLDVNGDKADFVTEPLAVVPIGWTQASTGLTPAEFALVNMAEANAATAPIARPLAREVITFGTGIGGAIGETGLAVSDRYHGLVSAATPANTPTLQMPDLSTFNGFADERHGTLVNMTGQDVIVDPNGNTAIQNSVDTLKDRYVYAWRQTGPSFYQLFETGKLDQAIETYTGPQQLHYWSGQSAISNSTHNSIDIGFDVRGCDWVELTFRKGATVGANWNYYSRWHNPKDEDKNMSHYWDAQYIWVRKGAGNIIQHRSYTEGNHYLIEARGMVNAANGYVIPTATVIATPRIITLTGGLNTIGGQVNATALEGVPTVLNLDLTAGFQIDVASIDVGTIEIADPINGTVIITAGNADATITITERTAATRQGLQLIGQYRPAEFEVNNSNITTGLDLTRPTGSLRLQFTDTGASGRVWPLAEIDLEELREANGFFVWNHDTAYLTGNIVDLASGQFTLTDTVRAARFIFAELVDFAENGFVIPSATVSKTQVTVSASGDSTTVNGGAASGNYLEGAGTNSIIIDLPVGQSINKTATETAINALAGANGIVTDVLNGIIEFTIAEGTGNVALPITHVPVVNGAQLFEFQQSNTAQGPVGGIEGWTFDFRNDYKEMRILNYSGKDRMVRLSTSWKLGASIVTNGGNKVVGLPNGSGTGLSTVDLSFVVAGNRQYGLVEVWELDTIDDRLVKLHDLNIRAVVGSGYNNNDWRVELTPA